MTLTLLHQTCVPKTLIIVINIVINYYTYIAAAFNAVGIGRRCVGLVLRLVLLVSLQHGWRMEMVAVGNIETLIDTATWSCRQICNKITKWYNSHLHNNIKGSPDSI